MYGFDHLPPINSAIQVDEFYGQTASGATSGIYAYTVPRNATFLYAVLIGGGGAGGGATPGVAQFGGGGGGSGAITKGLFPCILLPNIIYVYVSGQATGNGGNVMLMLEPSALAAATSRILSTAGGGVGATGGASGNGGSAGGVSSVSSDMRWAGSLALWVSQVGRAGGAGSATNGTGCNPLDILPLSGGGGGGGSSGGNGGGQTMPAGVPYPSIANTPAGENPGKYGYMLNRPFLAVGGTGGAGVNAAGTGLAKGGNGAIGCGGGGGGNCASGTAGAGGNGGHGYCMIVAF